MMARRLTPADTTNVERRFDRPPSWWSAHAEKGVFGEPGTRPDDLRERVRAIAAAHDLRPDEVDALRDGLRAGRVNVITAAEASLLIHRNDAHPPPPPRPDNNDLRLVPWAYAGTYPNHREDHR